MQKIHYIERSTGREAVEQVYGEKAVKLLYGEGIVSWMLSRCFRPSVAWLFSKIYGYLQTTSKSRKKIRPFLETYQIDEKEFADPVDSFGCFNDFFIRKLKPSSRPIQSDPERAILPADGRYLVYRDLAQVSGFFIKGQEFSLPVFLDDPVLSRRFSEGSMVIARLCPTDYHRFHFPCDGKASKPRLINGPLFSVNPIALRKKLSILWENKRLITEIESLQFGLVLMIEIGATAVGSIHQTYEPCQSVYKGDEKGFFSFGGSCIVLLFEKGRIKLDEDLVINSRRYLETRANFGGSLGTV
jgi:phosphatidylserine decarboxylase